MIDDFEHKLSIFDRYIQTYASNGVVEVIAAKDCNELIRFNTGVLLFRKNSFSRSLVNAWWDHRLASKTPSKDQAMLIEVVKEQNLALAGKFKAVPQRENDLNINTFTEGYSLEECFAKPGDYVTQPAGSHDKLRHIFAKIADIQKKHARPLSISVYFYYDQLARYISEMNFWSMHQLRFPKVSLRGIKEFIAEVLTSDEFYKAFPVITVLTVVTLAGVFLWFSEQKWMVI